MRKRIASATLVLAALAGAAWWSHDSGSSTRDISELARDASSQLGSVSREVIAQSDLPPEGTRSLFDHLLAQNNGLVYPFEDLLELLSRQAPEDDAFRSVMIPLGRSLLKGSADFEHPRVVVAADFHARNSAASLGIAPRGQLFLGFTEDANEIEVISYNEAAGRFEFQLVQNYCDTCVPRIVYAKRAICLTCHQGGSPIFSVRPWQETNGQPEIARRIVEARGEAPYLGVDPVQPLSSPERLDELTDVGNFINVAQRAWLDGCGPQGAACRRLMLREALRFLDDPSALRKDSPEVMELLEAQALSWPAAGIGVPDNDLANRDPLHEEQDLLSTFKRWFSQASEATVIVRDNSDLASFERLPSLPAPLDPLSPRGSRQVLTQRSTDSIPALARMMTHHDRDALLGQSEGQWNRVIAAVQDMSEDSFSAKPFSRVAVVSELYRVLGGQAPDYCCLDTGEMSPAELASEDTLEISPGSSLEPFESYCFACHRGNPAKRLDFMSGPTEQIVLEQIRDTTKIRDALDWERYRGTDKEALLMPPTDSAQYDLMLSDLESDPELRARMREMVPGLFDF